MPPVSRRVAVALGLPLPALGLQWLLWPWLSPFAWVLFYPTVFVSARLGGRAAGLGSTALCTALGWYFFLEPRLDWRLDTPTQAVSALLFAAVGVLLSTGMPRPTEVARPSPARHPPDDLTRAAQVVAHSADLLAFIDTDRRYVMCNPAYATMLGLQPADVQGRPVFDVVGPVFHARISARLDRALAGETQHFAVEITAPDGRLRMLDADYRPVEVGGQVQGVVVSAHDVTAMQEAEAALRTSEERLQLMLEATGSGLWDWDLRSGKVYRSPRYYALTGHAPDQARPDFSFFQKIVHPDDLAQALAAIDDHQQGRTSLCEFDFRPAPRPDGRTWLRSTGRVVERDAQGAPLRMVGILSDVSAQKAADAARAQQTDELARHNQALERFNRATVGRELAMIALKQQVNDLHVRLALPPPYRLPTDASTPPALVVPPLPAPPQPVT